MRISHVGINVFSIQHCTKISWRGRIELVGRIPARKRIFRKKGNPAYGGAAGMKHPASSQLTSYVVVVRVNGSHLIKNYLITFLALISGAWLSLARAPRLPSLTFSFPPSPSLCLPRARSAHTTTSFNPLSPSSTVSCLLHLLLHPPSLLHFVHNVQPAAKSLSWFPFFFSLSSATPSPALPPANNPTPSPLSLSLCRSAFLSPLSGSQTSNELPEAP